MKIVQVGQYPLVSGSICGGIESSVYGLATELAKQDQHVHVFDYPRKGGIDGIKDNGLLVIHRYNNPGIRNHDMLVRAQDMAHDIFAVKPDVVHLHGTGELTMAIYSAVKETGVPVLLTVHGLARVEKRNMIGQAFRNHQIRRLAKLVLQYVRQNHTECHLFETIDRVIVDTGYLVEALKNYPVKKLPELHVIPQGANDRFFNVKRLTVFRDKTILCVGAYSRRKGQVLLIKSYERLRNNGIDAKLVLCGAVSETDYYNEVKMAIDASKYKKNIFLYENKPQDFILEQYQKATVFALHSQEESQGIVLAEAMACGLPVVSTLVGGIPYVVEDGKTGLLTAYGDVEATAAALGKLLLEEKLYAEYSAAAKITAEKYRWSAIANNILLLYKK